MPTWTIKHVANIYIYPFISNVYISATLKVVTLLPFHILLFYYYEFTTSVYGSEFFGYVRKVGEIPFVPPLRLGVSQAGGQFLLLNFFVISPHLPLPYTR